MDSEQLPYWKRLYQIASDEKDLILKSFKNLLQEALELVSFKKNLKYCEFFLSGTTILNSIFLAVWPLCTLVRHNYLVKQEISTFSGANSTESSEFTTTFKLTNLTRADLLHGMTAAVSVSMPLREPVMMNFLDLLMYLSLIRMLLHGNNVLLIMCSSLIKLLCYCIVEKEYKNARRAKKKEFMRYLDVVEAFIYSLYKKRPSWYTFTQIPCIIAFLPVRSRSWANLSE